MRKLYLLQFFESLMKNLLGHEESFELLQYLLVNIDTYLETLWRKYFEQQSNLFNPQHYSVSFIQIKKDTQIYTIELVLYFELIH